MADNATTQSTTLATLPAGDTYGFDDVAGVKIARSKTGFGADGSYTDVSASDPLPVVQTGTPALPSGAATSAKQDTLIASVDGVEALLGTIDADTGSIAVNAATLAGAVSGTEVQVDVLTMPAVTVTGVATLAEQQTQTTAIGATNETAAGSDTAAAGLNGRLQRIAQRLTSLIALLPASLGAGGGLKVDGSGTALPVSLASLPSLAAGTNGIGKLTANSGVDIGDVDVTSVVGSDTNAAAQTTVTNSSTTIIASRAGRRGVLLLNLQTVPVYIDPSGGTAATTHFRLDPGASVVLPVTSTITGITSAAYSASGDAKVHYVELY